MIRKACFVVLCLPVSSALAAVLPVCFHNPTTATTLTRKGEVILSLDADSEWVEKTQSWGPHPYYLKAIVEMSRKDIVLKRTLPLRQIRIDADNTTASRIYSVSTAAILRHIENLCWEASARYSDELEHLTSGFHLIVTFRVWETLPLWPDDYISMFDFRIGRRPSWFPRHTVPEMHFSSEISEENPLIYNLTGTLRPDTVVRLQSQIRIKRN